MKATKQFCVRNDDDDGVVKLQLTDLNLDVLGVVAEFVPEEFRNPVCTQLAQLCKNAKKSYFSAAHRRLNDLLVIDLSYFNRKNIVIAGGSIIYALNNYVSRKYVEDVDIWILNEDEDEEKQLDADLTNANYYAILRAELRYTMDWVNVVLDYQTLYKGKKMVQVLTTKCKTPEELIARFNVTPTRCYFYLNRFYRTESAADTHFTAKTNVVCGLFSSQEMERIVRILNNTRPEDSTRRVVRRWGPYYRNASYLEKMEKQRKRKIFNALRIATKGTHQNSRIRYVEQLDKLIQKGFELTLS